MRVRLAKLCLGKGPARSETPAGTNNRVKEANCLYQPGPPFFFRKTEKTEMIGDKMKFSFEQPVPVMSYLIAVAAGHLEARQIGPR